MNERKICILLLFIFILLNGCKNEDKLNDSNLFCIDLDQRDKVSLKDLCSDIELIPLETNEESIINRIYSILEFNHHFYILDERQNAVFIFDRFGKFVKKIFQEGRGPREYNCLDAICINRYTGNLELLDAFGKLLTYDCLGNYISEIKLPYPPLAYHDFENLNRDTILLYTSSFDVKEDVLRLYSRSSNKIISEFCPEITLPIEYEKLIFVRNDTVFYFRTLDNNIYYIQGNKLKVVYRWDFGKNNFRLSEDLFVTGNDMGKLYGLMDKIPYLFQSRVKFSRYAYASIDKKKQTVNVFYDTQGTNTFVFSKTVEGVALNPCLVSDSCFVATVVPAEISKYLNEKILSPSQYELLQKVTEEDNPIIVKYHFKEKL